MNSQDLEALKALAEKATPGPWEVQNPPPNEHWSLRTVRSANDELDGKRVADTAILRDDETAFADAAFIAAFNPQTALALLSHITALEAEKADARRLALDEMRSAVLSNGIRHQVELEGDEVTGAAAYRRFVIETIDALKERP